MDNNAFDQIKNRIKNAVGTIQTKKDKWYRWEDRQGNIYGWCNSDNFEYLFYAGEWWKRFAGEIKMVKSK